jgi:hypothetical protein
LGGFALRFFIHHSAFCLHLGVALGALPAISSFIILPSTFTPVWL